MYPGREEAIELFARLQHRLREAAGAEGELPVAIVCPPVVSLMAIAAIADPRLVRLGAQNCHWESSGPHTGEVSPAMLAGLADYVLVGHSERRQAGETDEQIARKVAAGAGAGLVPILFVGEDDRSEDAIRLTEQRLRHGLSRIDVGTQEVLIVYEPSWAIGAKEPAPPEHIRRAVQHLKGVLTDMGTREPKIIYGGTVNDDNVDEIVRLEVLDGVGAARGSLNPEGFLRIIDRVGTAP